MGPGLARGQEGTNRRVKEKRAPTTKQMKCNQIVLRGWKGWGLGSPCLFGREEVKKPRWAGAASARRKVKHA